MGAWVGGKAEYLRHRVPSSGVREEDVVEELTNPLHVLRDGEDRSKGFVEVSFALRVKRRVYLWRVNDSDASVGITGNSDVLNVSVCG